MTEQKRTLPDFENPPVIETVLGVQFAPLEEFKIQHFGLYWSMIRGQYREVEVYPPLGATVEDFGEARTPVELVPLQVRLTTSPAMRCWFIDETKNHLLQVQKDRFIHNWRKVKGDEHYPHYENIQPIFKAEWLRFTEFLQKEKLGAPDVNQCEVTYVNHIELGGGIDSLADIHKLIAGWSGRSSGNFLPKPEMVGLNANYVIGDQKGRLYISLAPVIRSRDAQAVLQLNVSARGRPASSHIEDILDWLNLGRSWVVQGFTDFTTSEMHRYWRRII